MAGIKTAGSWLANKIWWGKVSNNIGAEPFRLENCKKKRNVWENITSNCCLINFRNTYQFHWFYDFVPFNFVSHHQILLVYELKKRYWQNIAEYSVDSVRTENKFLSASEAFWVTFSIKYIFHKKAYLINQWPTAQISGSKQIGYDLYIIISYLF